MRMKNCFSSLLVLALTGTPGAAVQGQQAPAAAAAQNVTAVGNPQAKRAPVLTEEDLRQRYVGKLVFIRGFYMADDLNFDMNGKIEGTPPSASFTLSALEIRKVELSKKKLDLYADRYALHFAGALPYEEDAKSFDKVKISSKPVHITIERELVVIPKLKKKKEKDKDKKAAAAAKPVAVPAPGTAPATESVSVAEKGTEPAPVALEPGATTSPAHSSMLLSAALDKILASDIDSSMVAKLPDYWQAYFLSKQERHEFMPADPNVHEVGGDVTPPKVLNSIDPSSNEYAQKYGITGLAMLRTVVDANGNPEQIAIDRPIGFGLDEKAVEAIRHSRFTPAMENGRAVPVVINLVVTFRIYSNRTKPGSVIKGAKETQVVASAWDSDSSSPSSSSSTKSK